MRLLLLLFSAFYLSNYFDYIAPSLFCKTEMKTEDKADVE